MSETEFSDVFLEHHGVKGMKWGVRRTPEQLGYRKKTKRKTSSIISQLRKNAKKKAAKSQKTKEEKKEESREEIRAKLLKSTDPKYISKHMDLLDTRELQERIDRITKETTMKKLAAGKDKDKVKKGEDALKTISNVMDSVSKIADSYGKISDAANKTKKQSGEDAKKKAETKAADTEKALKNKMEEERKALKAEEDAKRRSAINKALMDLNKSGDIENINPSKLMSSIDAANKAYDLIKTFSDVEISFDPATGEPKFKKKRT